jgi:hypothetical protein
MYSVDSSQQGHECINTNLTDVDQSLREKMLGIITVEPQIYLVVDVTQ